MFVNDQQLRNDPITLVLFQNHFTALIATQANPNYRFQLENPDNLYPNLNWDLTF